MVATSTGFRCRTAPSTPISTPPTAPKTVPSSSSRRLTPIRRFISVVTFSYHDLHSEVAVQTPLSQGS